MKKIICILVITLITQYLPGQKLFEKEPEVRVRIIHNLDNIDFRFLGTWSMTTHITKTKLSKYTKALNFSMENNNIAIEQDGNKINTDSQHVVLSCGDDSSSITIKNVPYGVGWWWEGKEDREYNGEFSIYLNDNQKFEVVVKLPLEEYLKGVVPYEIGGDSPLEALKAQAIAARSEAIIALTSKLYSGPHHDLTSDVECQVFSGNKKQTESSDKAVEETKAFILSEKGKPINAYYASNCGGHSELIKNVWPDRPICESYSISNQDNNEDASLDLSNDINVREWILSSPDVFCNPNLETSLPQWSQNNFRWTREYEIQEMSRMIANGEDIGILIDIIPQRRGESGRIVQAQFVFEKDTVEIHSELAIRQLWKPALRSSCFVVDKTESSFIINGAGWGHGVGMCQTGAVGMAKKGADYKTILKHYYPKADLISIF